MSASDTVIDTRRERMDGRETEDELKACNAILFRHVRTVCSARDELPASDPVCASPRHIMSKLYLECARTFPRFAALFIPALCIARCVRARRH